MASWAIKQVLSGEYAGRSFATDGVDIYFLQLASGSYHVHKYDVSEDTVSQISDGSSFGSAGFQLQAFNMPSLAWFDGNLYAVVRDSGADSYVYKYSSGTTWSQVLSLTDGDNFVLYCTNDHLIVSGTDDPVTGAGIGKYSANGTAWSAISYDNSPPYEAEAHDMYPYVRGRLLAKGVYRDYSSDHLLPEFATTQLYRLFAWSVGSFNIVATYDLKTSSGDDSVLNYLLADILHWKNDTVYQFSADFVSWTTPGNDEQDSVLIEPIATAGFAGFDQAIGTRDTGSELKFHRLAAGAWDIGGETVPTSGTGREIVSAVRLNDGYGYLFTSTGTQVALVGRDTPFSAPPAKFYHGADSLAYKSDLPFADAGGMGVRRDGVVAVGNGAIGAATVVVRGSDSDDYAAWTDITDNLTPSSGGVKALDWING